MDIASNLLAKLLRQKLIYSPFYKGPGIHALLDNLIHMHLIKDNQRRKVIYLQTSSGNFYLKCTHILRAKDKRRFFLLPWRITSEWRNLHRMLKSRLATSDPVLRAKAEQGKEKCFFLLTREVEGEVFNWNLSAHWRSIALYLARMHERGFYHADFHPANIFIQTNNQTAIIDLQELYRLPWIPRRLRVRNISKLWLHILPLQDSPLNLNMFLSTYNQAQRFKIDKAEIIKASKVLLQEHYASRVKKCCRNSSHFEKFNDGNVQGYRKKGFDWGYPDLHKALHNGQALKENKLFLFEGICIKAQSRRFLRPDKCLKAWKNSRALTLRKIEVPEAYGYFRERRCSYFLSDHLAQSNDLNSYLDNLKDFQEKRRALKQLAAWLKKIHSQNVWQRDFKSRNVLCTNGSYYMVDLEGVKIARRLSRRRILKNLAQLNASLSNAVSLRERLLFYRYYCGADKLRSKRRRDYKKVLAITRKKNTYFFGLDFELILKQQLIGSYLKA